MQKKIKSQEKDKNSKFSVVYSRLCFLCKQTYKRRKGKQCNMSRLPIHTQESISESCSIRQNLDCNYIYPNDFAPNEIPFDDKSL